MKNIVREKSFHFALRIVKLCNFLQKTKHESVMTNSCCVVVPVSVQMWQSQSMHKAEQIFLSKLNIALNEATETDYWLRLLHEAGYLNDTEFQSVFVDCKEIESLLAAIVKTTKK